MCFLPRDEAAQQAAVGQFSRFVRNEGQHLLGWRDVPVNTAGLGTTVLAEMPVIRQAIVARGDNVKDEAAFERKLLEIRKQTQNPLTKMAQQQNLPELSPFRTEERRLGKECVRTVRSPRGHH